MVVVVCGISFLEEETNLEATKDPHTLIAFWGEFKKGDCVCTNKKVSEFHTLVNSLLLILFNYFWL